VKCKWGQAPPSGTPPLHPTKSAPDHRDFAGTPESGTLGAPAAHRFPTARDVRGVVITDSHARAKPLLAAAPALAEEACAC